MESGEWWSAAGRMADQNTELFADGSVKVPCEGAVQLMYGDQLDDIRKVAMGAPQATEAARQL